MVAHAVLIEHADLAVAQPLEIAGLDAVPAEIGAPLRLAPEHGEINVGAAGIAKDHAILEAEQIAHEVAVGGAARRSGGRANHEFLGQEIFRLAHGRRRIPCQRDADITGGTAEPAQLERIETLAPTLAGEQRIENQRR